MRAETRRLSAAIFNNDKFTEVVLELDAHGGPATAQEQASALGITHDLVRKVLLRLTGTGTLKTLPRIGGSRGALPYDVQPSPEWDTLTSLCRLLMNR